MSTALPADPFAAWLLQQAPSVVILAILCIALWRRDDQYRQDIAANAKAISSNADAINKLTEAIKSLEGRADTLEAAVIRHTRNPVRRRVLGLF